MPTNISAFTVVRNGETVTLVPWEYTVLSDASIRYVDQNGVVWSHIELPATDIPGVTAESGLQYKAQRWYAQDGVPLQLGDFLFEAPAGGLGSLSSLAPVDVVEAVPITRGEAGRGITSTQNVDGRLVISYTDGTTDDVGPLPVSGAGFCPV